MHWLENLFWLQNRDASGAFAVDKDLAALDVVCAVPPADNYRMSNVVTYISSSPRADAEVAGPPPILLGVVYAYNGDVDAEGECHLSIIPQYDEIDVWYSLWMNFGVIRDRQAPRVFGWWGSYGWRWFQIGAVVLRYRWEPLRIIGMREQLV